MKLLAHLPVALFAAAVLIVASTPASAQTSPPAAFAACKVCHSAEKGGRNGVGPNLYGVVGRPAARQPGFSYSAALRNAKLRWDPATLDQYISAPMKKVPGTRMPIGLADPAKRAAVIAYLKAQSGS